jgi:hypothetical protein
MRIAAFSLLWIGQVCLVLMNVMLWSCRIFQHLCIQPLSHQALCAFGELNMGLVRPDYICREPMVTSRVFDIVPCYLMWPHIIHRWSRSLVTMMD